VPDQREIFAESDAYEQAANEFRGAIEGIAKFRAKEVAERGKAKAAAPKKRSGAPRGR
jgi:hypothetical protein